MNAISQHLNIEVEQNQVEEVVLALFHTILLHRSSGKYCYQADDSFQIKDLAYEDVNCGSFKLTYMRCQSEGLHHSLSSQVAGFVAKLSKAGVPTNGKVSLEFYEKKKKGWFNDTIVPWEVWTVELKVTQPHERIQFRERLGAKVRENIWDILQAVHKHDYVPPNPTKVELASVFETEYTEVQPYLFKVEYSIAASQTGSASVSKTVTKLFRDIATS